MKYGRLLFNYGDYAKRLKGFNIGDAVQIEALNYIYKQMGITEEQIQDICYADLQTYDGEYVLLPMLGVAIGLENARLPLSPKIIPVFFSAHFAASEFNNKTLEYLKRYEPIGCRDEYSMNNLRKKGIQCYLSGCITVTLPRREASVQGEKVFFIDVPERAMGGIPVSLREKAEMLTHLLPMEPIAETDEAARFYQDCAKTRLQKYAREAALVVSSRIHALAPCAAMGIPVIAITENCSERFGWIDRYLSIYTPENMDEITWDPAPVEFEQEKEKIVQLAVFEIQNAYEKWKLRCEVSDFYEARTKSRYGSRYYYLLETLPRKEEKFDFIIWGCGLIGESVYKAMENLYPQARMVAAIDKFVEGTFHDVQILKPEQLADYPTALVLLANYSGKKEGYRLMKKLGREEGRDFLFLGTQNG